jgi:transcriptional regulator with XRE-family HTH domain
MLKRLGGRIRAERNRLGLTLEAFAAKVGVSKMTLQRIETGVTSPSIVTLTDISFHLKQPIESLIREGEPKVVVLKAGEQESLFDPESGIRILAPPGLVSERVTITCARLEQGAVIEPHANKGFEWAYLIEGRAVVTVGANEYPLEGGDAIFYDAHHTHSISVLEDVQYVGLFLRDE